MRRSSKQEKKSRQARTSSAHFLSMTSNAAASFCGWRTRSRIALGSLIEPTKLSNRLGRQIGTLSTSMLNVHAQVRAVVGSPGTSAPGETSLKGFDEPVRLFEVRWQD